MGKVAPLERRIWGEAAEPFSSRTPKTLPFVWNGHFAGEAPSRPVYRTPIPDAIQCCEAVMQQVEDLQEEGLAEHTQNNRLGWIWHAAESIRNVARWHNKHHDSLRCRLTTAFQALREIPERGPLLDHQRETLAAIETELRRVFAADLHLVKFGETQNETLPDIFF